jgi:hypothetical protein
MWSPSKDNNLLFCPKRRYQYFLTGPHGIINYATNFSMEAPHMVMRGDGGPADASSKHLWNVSTFQREYTAPASQRTLWRKILNCH